MKRIFTFIVGLAVVFSSTILAYCEEQNSEVGRYTLLQISVGQELIPILLDTETGKMWLYQKSGSFGGEMVFKGVNVEGVAYSTARAEDIRRQVADWYSNGLVDKDIKGYIESMLSEFSYSMDLIRAQELNDQMRGRQIKK